MEEQNNFNQTQNSNMKPCSSCGNMISKKATACPSCGAKIKKPIYKRVWFIILMIFLAIFIIAVAASGGEDSQNDTNPQANTNNAAVVTESTESNLGDFKVEIKSCKLSKDYEGKPIAIVTYAYTNNGKEPTAFFPAFEEHAYQNGVEAEHCYYTGNDEYDNQNNQSKEIKSGVTIDVMVAYSLNDTTTPVEIEVGRLFSFDNTKITKTFNF